MNDEAKPLRQLFVEMIGMNSVDNEKVAELYFHCLLGAYFNNYLIKTGINGKDLRVSVFWIQQSRTGKGELNKAFQKICEALNIKIATITEITTAGLIGSIDSEAATHNKKYGLSEESRERMLKKGDDLKAVRYIDPIIKGDLANYDILIFDEAKTLLQQSQYTENLLSNLQPTLDHPGYVRKKLRHEVPIEYKCSPTIIATTYYFGEISKVLAEQGFFQRVVMFIRDMTVGDIKYMRQKQRDLMMQKDSNKDFSKKLRIFTKRLEGYNSKDLQLIRIGDDATNTLMDLGNNFIRHIERNLSGSELYVALSFTNTLQEMALKVAAQNAIISGKKLISPMHVRQAFYIIKTYINTIINKLELSDKGDGGEMQKLLFHFKKFEKDKSEVAKTEFRDYVVGITGWGRNKASKKIDRMIYLNYIYQEEGKTRNKKILKKVE